jgi:hypothetical protein
VKNAMAISLVVLAWCSGVHGEQIVQEISWKHLQKAGQLLAGEVMLVPAGPNGMTEQLKIENREGKPKTIPVLRLEKPGISGARYGVRGSVRYQDAAAGSYLEMWNHFPSGKFFSRTLAPSGPLQRIEGSSDWRSFSLPFFSDQEAGPPSRLDINVVLAGNATVWLSPLRLVQYDESEDPLAFSGAWWSDHPAGLIGGIAGTILGCLGGLVGTLAGLGKARSLVIGLMVAMLVVGVAGRAARGGPGGRRPPEGGGESPAGG